MGIRESLLKQRIKKAGKGLSIKIGVELKVHPAAGAVARVLQRAGTLVPASFEIVKGAFADIVEKVALVIGNTSTTCLESLGKGVPVFVVGNGFGLTQNPIPEEIDQDLWRLCDTAGELRTALWLFAERSESKKKRHESLSKKIRDIYFEPVTREGVRKFLRLERP